MTNLSTSTSVTKTPDLSCFYKVLNSLACYVILFYIFITCVALYCNEYTLFVCLFMR